MIGLEASTSYYTLYQTFLKKGYHIKVANTIQLRQLIAKNDKLDAQRLSEMLRLGTFPCSYIPEEKIQHLRSMIQMRHALMQEKVRCNNRIQAFLDRNGVVMPPVKAFSKKWKHALMQHLGTGTASMELRYEYNHYVYLEKTNEQADQEIIGYTKTYWKLGIQSSAQHHRISESYSPAMSSLLSIRSNDSYQTGNSAGTPE